MQIVIDIPEEIKAVIDKNGTNEIVTETVWQAVKKGTPLPKGHGRLIDAISREELIEALDTWDKFGYAPTNDLIPLRGNVDKDKYVPYIHYDDVIECIKGMPSVTPQPCEDAISRQAVMDYFRKWQPYMATRLWDFEKELSELPSVTPQPKMGRWERMSDLPNDVDDRFECSRCGNVVHHRSVMDLRTFSRWCGRCGSYND